MDPPAQPDVTEIIGRFFAARRAGRRASVDEVLGSQADSGQRAQLRTVVLREIARVARSGEMPGEPGAERTDAADAGAVADELPTLEGYDIIDLIGRGGMGVVYEAYQQSTGRRVAIKFMLAAQQSAVGRRRFEREVELIARLHHPHVVSVLDCGAARGQYFYVMDFVDGRPLNEILTPGECPPREALALLRQVAEAVDYAHQRGVLHRDLKPSNILVDEHGSVRLLDFGLAKALEPGADTAGGLSISQPGQLVGTLAYMSPEQSRGELERISIRSDVYSLGAIAYELLTGVVPCSVDGPLPDVLARIAQAEPVKPSALRRGLDADLDAVVLKALDKSPQMRYATAGDLAADIGRHLEDKPIRARPAGVGRRVARWVRRHRGVSAVSSVALAVLLTVTIVWLVQIGAAHTRTARVERFFNTNLGFATPDVAKRATIERRDLLDYAAARVTEQLGDYPVAEADVRQALGVAYIELALYPEARAQLAQAAEIRRRELGPDHADLADTLHALALVQHHLNEYAAARENYQQALAIRLKRCGPRSAPVADTLNNLGWLAKDCGDYAEAERRYSAALELRRSLYGEHHPAVAETLNDLAHLYYVRGDLARAEEYFRAALAIRLHEHPDKRNTGVAATMASLGSVLNKLGRYAEAGPLLEEALAIRLRVCGPRHADTLVSRNEWGLYLLDTGQVEAAVQTLRENLQVREEVYGPRHRLTAVSLVNLGLCLEAQGSFEEAERLCRRALAVFMELYGSGKDHSDLAAVWTHLGSVLCEMGRTDEALHCTQRAVDMRMRLSPERGAASGHALGALGHVRLARGEWVEARGLLEKGLAQLGSETATGNWRVALARSDLGECLTQMGEFERAEPLLTDAYERIKAVQGAGSRYSELARSRIVTLYEKWGAGQPTPRGTKH